jgi:hypothetical protein
VVPVDLASTSQSFITRKGAYMASLGEVKVGYDCDFNVSPP